MLGGIAAFVALILFIVAHEAGHYFAAKATGMKVTEFFIGFGPRIWSFKKGETEYGIKPIPFGAYVKVVGMSALEEVPAEDLDRTYRVKPFWAKSLVVLSGVAANFFIAWLIFTGVAMVLNSCVIAPQLSRGQLRNLRRLYCRLPPPANQVPRPITSWDLT